MTIHATQTRSEFSRNTLRIFFYRGTGRFLLLMAVAFILIYLFQWVMVLFGWGTPTIYLLVAGIGFLTLLPALIYRKASMVYDSNPMVNQPVDYTFSEEGLRIQGKDLNAEVLWENVFLVAELRDAILMYYTSTIANPIPKRNFSEEELEALRQLVEGVPGLGTDMA